MLANTVNGDDGNVCTIRVGFRVNRSLRKFPCSIGLFPLWLRIATIMALLSENVRQQGSCDADHYLPQGAVTPGLYRAEKL
jgi:hypothetical protein